MKAFRYQDIKSDKFWFIRQDGSAYAVTYGKWGTQGRCEIKEFRDEEECSKQIEKQIAAKTKKGYKAVDDFDFSNRLYFDTDDFGPSALTSHPSFTEHFTADFYYDCGDEEAPFGSDDGSDTLWSLTEKVKKDLDAYIVEFPRTLLEKQWDMPFYPPVETDREALEQLLSQPADTLPMEAYVSICDRVIVATAFGQIKIMGKIAPRLKDMAIASLKRMELMDEIEERGKSYTIDTMTADLERFQV